MSIYSILKSAAADMRASADQIEALQKQASEINAAQEKTATDKAGIKKQAAEKQAALGALAKTAADKLLSAGLLSSPEKRDQFANACLDHATALSNLSKLAGHVQTPKLGSVVVDDKPAEKTAESTYDDRARQVLSRMNLR